MHVFESRIGRLWLDLKMPVSAYSGFGEGKNNPLLQNVPNLGPIPVGAWLLGKDDDSHGPVSIHLVHLAGETWGRGGFLVHGDAIAHPGQASHGCIITERPAREYLVNSRDRLLIVLPAFPLEVAV